MYPAIKPYDASLEFLTEERCYILELSNCSHDPAVSIAQARVPPGVTTRWHKLEGVIERYVILSGIGRVEVGEQPASTVNQGDVVLIPAACKQRIQNIGDTDLIFLAICTPRFRFEIYKDIDEGLEP